MKPLQYKDILTKKFFEKEYLKNKKSISQLQKQLGIDWNTIKYYLKFQGIILRSHKEQASISSPGGKPKYSKLLTKKFLVKEYVQNKKGVLDLSKELNLDQGTIRRYLKDNNLKLRGIKEQLNLSHPPKTFRLTKKSISFIDGLLLGDASIPKRKDGIDPRSLTQACKYKEYLIYIKRRLSSLGIESSPILSRWIKDKRCKKNGYAQHFFQTNRYKTFEIFRKRWYPQGKKIVPRDIFITKDLLLQLFLCDGNFYREIRFCTEGFDKSSVIFLKELLERRLEIKPNIRVNKGKYSIFIKKSETSKFLSFIGKCPVESYEYKWEDNESEEAKERKRAKSRERYKDKHHANFCCTIS